MSVATALRRDLLLAARAPSNWLTPLVFFLAVVAVFPLAIGPEPETLRAIAPGVIWTVALLSSLLTHESLFRADADDGSLEAMLLAPQPLVLTVLGKTAAHWIAYGAPLLLLAPLLGVWMHMRGDDLLVLLATLPLGTGVFSLLAAFAASLAVSARPGSFLGALLALPLCLPAVIFATAAASGDSRTAAVLLLAALFTFSLTVLPLATAGALRLGAQAGAIG